MPVDPNVVDRETLRRIYQKFQPDKVSNIDGILAKRKGDRAAMKDVFEHLGGTYKFDALALRAAVEKDLNAKAGPSSPGSAKKPASPAPKTASPVSKTTTPAAGTSATSPKKQPPNTVSAAASSSPTTTTALASSPRTSVSRSSPAVVAASSSTSPSTSALAAPATTTTTTAAAAVGLEAQTVARVARLLAKDDPAKASNAESLVKALHKSKGGITEKSVAHLIKSLEKRLGYTEADVGGKPVAAAASAGGAEMIPAFGPAAAGRQGLPGTTMKRNIAQLLHDGFGVAPDQRTVPVRRAAMTTEERSFYEQLLLPSVKMACADSEDARGEVQEALDEIFKRCETSVLPPRIAAEVRSARDVADRVVRALQSKYELRNPAGKDDFFAKFIPGNAQRAAASAQAALQQQKLQQAEKENAAATGVTGSGFSLDSNPMAVSRMIAQSTLASSMISSSQFLGEDDDMAAADARLRDAAGSTVSDLGPLPAEMGSDGRSFTAMLTSAMKFLDSSSAAAADPAAALLGGGRGGVPQSDKEVLRATFVVEFLQWADVAQCPEPRRERFKLAVAQDVADVLGWGELSAMPFSGSASASSSNSGGGRHSWRNVITRKFSHSTAGNVHAECSIIVPAGISVEDLHARLRAGFPMPRSRVSLSRDLEARPAKLYCRTATFGESDSIQESVVPEMMMDSVLGVNISPHRNVAMNPAWPKLPVSP